MIDCNKLAENLNCEKFDDLTCLIKKEENSMIDCNKIVENLSSEEFDNLTCLIKEEDRLHPRLLSGAIRQFLYDNKDHIVVQLIADQFVVDSKLLDVSLGGISLVCEGNLFKDTNVELIVFFKERNIKVNGVVRHSRFICNLTVSGIEFLDISEEARVYIQELTDNCTAYYEENE